MSTGGYTTDSIFLHNLPNFNIIIKIKTTADADPGRHTWNPYI